MALTNGIYKGKGLSLTIDAVEYNMDISSASLTSEDLEVITFADMASGNKQWTLTVTALFDAGTGSLWRYVWDNAGTDAVAFKLTAYGNDIASDTQPFISGNINIGSKPDWSTDANSASETEMAFEVVGEPSLVTV